MKRTNIFAKDEEIKELKKLLEEAQKTPVIALSVAQGIAGNDFASQARKRMFEKCHKLALEHGLPEIAGFYGCDLETGEFVSS